MEKIAAPKHTGAAEREQIRVLVADGDQWERSLLASRAQETLGGIVVLEAEDGGEAIQLGLQRDPEIALLDVELPGLGGLDAALTLRELKPRMRLALRSRDPFARRGARAGEERLPLFGKLELGPTLAWLAAQMEWFISMQSEAEASRKRSLVCGACGYGILRATPPSRCPMCEVGNAWVDAPHLSPTLSWSA